MEDHRASMGRAPAADRLRAPAAQLATELGARLVVLFGSAAREEGRPPEDLDVAVLCDGGVDAVAATNRLIALVGDQRVDVADLARADALLLMLVARDGVPLYEAAPGEFARFCSLAARRYADTRKFRVAERDAIRDFVARRARGR
jgi:predicted nucleotidyltransferase